MKIKIFTLFIIVNTILLISCNTQSELNTIEETTNNKSRYVWNVDGTYFGYIANDRLYHKDGRYIGIIDDNYVFDNSGQYLGKINNNDRFIVGEGKAKMLKIQPVQPIEPIKPIQPIKPMPTVPQFPSFP